MNYDPRLKDALGRLAQALPHEASPAAERRTLAAFRTRKRRMLRRTWTFWATVAAACLLLALAWLSKTHAPQPSADPAIGMTGFVALPYAQSDVPLEQALIVHVDLDPTELGMLGLPARPRNNGRVSADLLIGQDGIARAVRVVE